MKKFVTNLSFLRKQESISKSISKYYPINFSNSIKEKNKKNPFSKKNKKSEKP